MEEKVETKAENVADAPSAQAMFRKNKKQMNIMEKNGLIFVLIILIPVILNFIVFWGGVNINSIALAFTAKDAETGKEIFSLYHFEKLFRELKSPTTAVGGALITTMKYFIAHLAKIFLCVIIAYFFYKKLPGHQLYKILFYLPAMLPSMVYITIFKELLSDMGPIFMLLKKLFNYTMPSLFALGNPARTTAVVIFYVMWSGFGTSMLIYVGAMNRIPNEVLEAAFLDGCGMAREFFQIVMPLIWETFGTYFLLAFTGIFMETGPLLYFVGEANRETQTINYWMFLQVTAGEYNYPSAIGLFFSVLTVPFVIVSRWLITRIETVTY